MKLLISTLLLFVSFSTYSQTEQEIYLGTINQETESLNGQVDENMKKELSKLAPIDEALDNLRANGQLPKAQYGSTFESMTESYENKVKMVDYSDKKFEEGYTKNEDGTWSPNEVQNNDEDNEPITEETYEYKKKGSTSIVSKIFSIIMLVALWFAAGFVINYIIYNNRPDHELGTSNTAKFLHIVANIILVIMILKTLFE